MNEGNIFSFCARLIEKWPQLRDSRMQECREREREKIRQIADECECHQRQRLIANQRRSRPRGRWWRESSESRESKDIPLRARCIIIHGNSTADSATIQRRLSCFPTPLHSEIKGKLCWNSNRHFCISLFPFPAAAAAAFPPRWWRSFFTFIFPGYFSLIHVYIVRIKCKNCMDGMRLHFCTWFNFVNFTREK